MKTILRKVYASTRRKKHWELPEGLDWKTVAKSVKRLQMRIAKAAKQGRHRLVRSLQWILAHSYFAKLLAIWRVTSNKGKTTPGVDGVVWKSPRQKGNAVNQLNRRGYKALPLRRVYIPKKSGKLRPLGIPTMRDRAMQALYALTLAPLAETFADPNSYGFREHRSCADAIKQCFVCLSGKHCTRWIFEADIDSCFDNISHQWMLGNIPVDKKMLTTWLQAGFLDKGNLYPTLSGTPQGGIISPLLMNMTLDGLEQAVKNSAPRNMPNSKARTGIRVIRYADDFTCTGKTKELLEEHVIPAVKDLLKQRGLSLSVEKSRIIRIDEGFDFLGQHIRKYKDGKLIITPTRKSVQGLLEKLRCILNDHQGDDTWSMIHRMNQVVQGWCNYHRHVCSYRIFRTIDKWLYFAIKRWMHRRHPNKGIWWNVKKYYRRINNRHSFHAVRIDKNGKKKHLDLIKAGRIRIIRHVKIKAEANPYDPAYTEYLANRKARKHNIRGKRFVEESGLP